MYRARLRRQHYLLLMQKARSIQHVVRLSCVDWCIDVYHLQFIVPKWHGLSQEPRHLDHAINSIDKDEYDEDGIGGLSEATEDESLVPQEADGSIHKMRS